MYRTDLVLNRNFRPEAPYGPEQQALLDSETMAAVREEVSSWPGYEPTPLVRLDGRAAASGIARMWCKHEGPRFDIGSFKPTGPTYAMLTVLRGEVEKAAGVRHVPTHELLDGRFAAAASGVTVCAATSGRARWASLSSAPPLAG